MGEENEDGCHEVEMVDDEHAIRSKNGDASSDHSGGRRTQRPWLVFIAIVTVFTLVLVLVSVVAYGLSKTSVNSVLLSNGATVYYNSACGDCVQYIQNDLTPTLRMNGVDTINLKDWTNHVSYREELFNLHRETEVDTSIMSHLTTFLKTDRLIVFEGHVPSELVSEVIRLNASTIPRMVVSVWDDGMTGDMPARYAIWAYSGAPQTYDMSTPPSAYLDWMKGQTGGLWTPDSTNSMAPLVMAAGFIDGLNPCAFAVLLFFISLLFAMRSPAIETVKMGSIYIYAIFLVYLMIGLGLLGAIVLSPDPHFMAKVGAVMMVLVAGITITNYFLPKIPMPFHMPKATWNAAKKWMMRATLPGAAVAGLLVGLCTFPCSGTIYVFVLGLLASQASFLTGLGYLYLYNIFFVMPLVIILAVIMLIQYAFKKPAARKFAQWERAHSKEFRLAGALIMIAMGIGFFLWTTTGM